MVRARDKPLSRSADDSYISYGTPTHEHRSPLVDETQHLIAFALADGALKGIKTIDQFFNQRIPADKNHLNLIWEAEVENLAIVRSVSKKTVTKEPLLARTFERAFKETLAQAGYHGTAEVQPTVHSIRRALAKEVDSKLNLERRYSN